MADNYSSSNLSDILGANSFVDTTTQAGIRKNANSFKDNLLFRSMLKTDSASLSQFDVFIGGYGIFWWTKIPPFIENYNHKMADNIRYLTENASTSFEGINDMQVNTEEVQGTMAGNSFKIVTNVKDDFDSFTMKCYEFKGSPLRECMEYWVTGIRDPKTGYCHYHGAVDHIDGGVCAKNETGELLYVVTDPSGSSNGIEYACLITNIAPTKVSRQHLNTTHGEHQIASVDIEFTGTKYESVFINEVAKSYVKAKRRIEHYLAFKPLELKPIQK